MQHLTGGKISQQIFRAAAQSFDRLAMQLFGKPLGQRPTEIATPHFDLGEARAFHGWREAAPHSLYFRQFGHD